MNAPELPKGVEGETRDRYAALANWLVNLERAREMAQEKQSDTSANSKIRLRKKRYRIR